MDKKLWQQVFQYGLAAIIVGALISTIMVLINAELSASVHDALMILLGVEGAGFTTIVQYFFGSSKGSSDKNDMINNSK